MVGRVVADSRHLFVNQRRDRDVSESLAAGYMTSCQRGTWSWQLRHATRNRREADETRAHRTQPRDHGRRTRDSRHARSRGADPAEAWRRSISGGDFTRSSAADFGRHPCRAGFRRRLPSRRKRHLRLNRAVARRRVRRCGRRRMLARGLARCRLRAEIARSASDIETVNEAHSQGRLLLTDDKHFGELVFRWRCRVPGLVLLRIEPEVGDLKWTRLNAAILRFGDGLLGRYTVVEGARFRSRPLIERLPRPSRS